MKKVSENPRMSIENPLYITNQERAISREALVEAEAGIDVVTSKTEELTEEPTVIYENEQFFHAAKRIKNTEVEDGVQAEEGRNRQPRYAYSQVIKKSNERAKKKKEHVDTSGVDTRSKAKGKQRDVYSQEIKKKNQKSEPNDITPKVEIDDNPHVPQKNFDDNMTSEQTAGNDDDNISCVVDSQHTDDAAVIDQCDQESAVGADVEGQYDEDGDDYINVTAPSSASFGDELFLNMSHKENEDAADYINCTDVTKPV